MTLPDAIHEASLPLVTAQLIGRIPLAAMPMENPDGTPLDITTDYFGRAVDPTRVRPGPVQGLTRGKNLLAVWPRE